MTTRKKFTVRELIDAIKANKVPWFKGNFFKRAYPKNPSLDTVYIGAACAIGVGAYNLGINPHTFEFQDNAVFVREALKELAAFNDAKAQSWEDIPAKAEELLGPYADVIISATERKYELV